MTEFKTVVSKGKYTLVFITDVKEYYDHVQSEARMCVDHSNLTGWISVHKTLPLKSGKYLVCNKSGAVYQTKFYTYGNNGKGHWGQKDGGKNITHWMFLPSPASARSRK